MPISLNIQPFSDVLSMYGDADSSSTFSLSGHVCISLTSSSSLLVRRKTTTRILLHSLTITFEGQSETLSPATGYAPIRLCSITRELLTGNPVEISNEGHEESENPCLWNVVFDIAVPGWLPITSVYGDASLQATGTSYALYATATFVNINHGHSTFSFANICGSVRSRAHTVDAPRCSIQLRRFIEPQSWSPSCAFPMSVYTIDACREPDPENPPRRCIPTDVLERIEVIASIPSSIATDEAYLPFILRFRGKGLGNIERKKLRITEFSVDLEQVEVYRNNFCKDRVDQYPVPPQTYQPPRVPLRNPHPMYTIYDTGFLGVFGPSIKRSFSLLAPTESGRYVISGDNRIFNLEQNPTFQDKGYILEAKIHMFTEPYLRDWAGTRTRRITESSPLFSVGHHMHVVICCEYDLIGETILERLHFSLPMRHVNVPEIQKPLRNDMGNQCEDLEKDLPYTHPLPAYSQLFHPNGERKHDCSIPLPAYEPHKAFDQNRILS